MNNLTYILIHKCTYMYIHKYIYFLALVIQGQSKIMIRWVYFCVVNIFFDIFSKNFFSMPMKILIGYFLILYFFIREVIRNNTDKYVNN